MEEILRLFPEHIQQVIRSNMKDRWHLLQEIRIRIYRPIELIFDNQTEWITHIKPDQQDGMFVLNQLSDFSLYRMEDELRQGYMTIEGGHRVGLAGKVNTLNGSVKAIQHITFMNIRIAKEKVGCAQDIIPYLYEGNYLNTLFIGAPQTGKTTLIRDVTRIIGTGWEHVKAAKVGIIDERSEIGGSIKGIPQHNIGLRSDVMDACPKAEGMMMMIRSMSPEILVVDEIGNSKDVQALMEAINAGVIVICTIHGNSISELKKRPSLKPLFQHQVFQRIALLDKQRHPGTVAGIFDANEKNILQKTRCLKDEVDWSTSFHRHNNYSRI
ncbi:stage III sporulation protein AA [Oceanobacillus halotolerans]|uniref:stage III sporulation protein AA n=1 Tax=Oceanobacillus halotolerans TaxID=2663380 RepID=UPI0013DAD589|nr:stage III sporulation protein AA [Oceanobacillus halotolerans]